MKIHLRKNIPKYPVIAYSAGIDLIDAFGTLITIPLSAIGIGIPFGLAIDTLVDIIQVIVAGIIFEEPDMWAIPFAGELILPQGFDVFPSFTAYVLIKEKLKK